MSYLPYAYFKNEIIPFEQATVSIATHALQYGTGVFGGIRGYYQQDSHAIHIFRLDKHIERVARSANFIRIALPASEQEIFEQVISLTQKNAPSQNCYYRPFAYKAGLDLTPTLTGVEDGFAIYMLAMDDFYTGDKGLNAMTSAWTRLSDSMIPARGKVSGGYINSSLAKDEARSAGFDEAILLNTRGKVSEGSAANIFMVRDGVLITPPVTADILEGIMRRSMLQLAQDLGIEVLERDIDRSELYIADELFFCGTGAQIKAIGSVDKRSIGNGARGTITSTLWQNFQDIISGKNSSYSDWVTKIKL